MFDRVRWMVVPIAAYLAITLVLPLANGAAGRAEFAVHAVWVLVGCAIVVGAVITVAALKHLVNTRRVRRVTCTGGSP